MKPINFLAEYYKVRASDQNQTRLLNMYLEAEEITPQGTLKEFSKYKVTAYQKSGLLAFNSGTGSVGRAIFNKRGVLYAVVDNKLYSYNSAGTRTELGTLNTSTGQVEIVDINGQLLINDRTDAYTYTIASTTFATISDGDFPTTPQSACAQDEFFLVSSNNTATVNGSDVSDGTSWNALSFGSKTGSGDYVKKLISMERRVYVLGEITSEVWYNSGAATFSFEVDPSVFYHFGIAAADSATKYRNKLYLLAQTQSGGVQPLVLEGYQYKPIGTFATNYQINNLSDVTDAIGFCYEQNGHEFYELTFPTGNLTLLYDATSDSWSEIEYDGDRSLITGVAYCFGKVLVCVRNSGKIYQLDPDTFTDGGTSITRELISAPAYGLGKKSRIHKLQLDFQTGIGSNPSFTVDVSRDSGQTYPIQLTGTVPDAGGRVFWTSLGQTQNAWVLRYRCTANADVALLGALAEAELGVH